MRRKRSNLNQRVMTGVVAMAIIVLLVCFMFLSLVSCSSDNPSFRVEGTLTGGADSTLVLEALRLNGVEALDSVRLDAQGHFAFRAEADTSSAPEFYRLRMGNRVINFVVDSIEDITIQASLSTMSTDYDIQGNEASRTMKTLAQLSTQLQQQLLRLERDGSLSALEKMERARVLVEGYKQTLKQDYILRQPASAASYFALFQTIGGQMLFNPESDVSDVQFFAAVATQWDILYPGSQRTENLKNIAIRGLRNTRRHQPVELQLDSDKIHETGIIDMGYPDIHGRERRLSDLRDHVVLLDFTAYALPESQQRNLELRELYNRYHDRGLEIYQVSLDADEHFWRTRCEQLPWVCVFCADGLNSDMLSLYAVSSLPAYFLIARGAEMRARQEQIDDLARAIEAEL